MKVNFYAAVCGIAMLFGQSQATLSIGQYPQESYEVSSNDYNYAQIEGVPAVVKVKSAKTPVVKVPKVVKTAPLKIPKKVAAPAAPKVKTSIKPAGPDPKLVAAKQKVDSTKKELASAKKELAQAKQDLANHQVAVKQGIA